MSARSNAQRQADFRQRRRAMPSAEAEFRRLMLEAYYLGRMDRADEADVASVDEIIERAWLGTLED